MGRELKFREYEWIGIGAHAMYLSYKAQAERFGAQWRCRREGHRYVFEIWRPNANVLQLKQSPAVRVVFSQDLKSGPGSFLGGEFWRGGNIKKRVGTHREMVPLLYLELAKSRKKS
jgi:hypothetical protein